MKKFSIFIAMTIGVLIGLFATLSDGFGLKILMMSIGLVVGGAIGSAFSGQKKNLKMPLDEDDDSFGQGVSADDRMRNFWRDNGETVRFMDPTDSTGAHFDFDQK